MLINSKRLKFKSGQLTNRIFQTPTYLGKIVLGIDGNDDVINLTA
jgi:hypothetical protein